MTASTSNAPDPGAHLEPYRSTLAAVGPQFQTLHWRDAREQSERFEAIAEMVPLKGRAVADIGCGRADLLFWLRRRRLAPGRYIGVDALDGLVEFCRHRAGRIPGCAFLTGDFVHDEGLFTRLASGHRPDVILFSGSLNTYPHDIMRSVMQRAWRALDHLGSPRRPATLVFNFLNERAVEQPADPTRAGPAHEMVAWAMARATEVTFMTGYLAGEDTTIAMSGPRAPVP